MAQTGSVLAWGARGRRFKSGRRNLGTKMGKSIQVVNYALMLLAAVFALIDNLFIGYFIWHFYGILAFTLMVTMSVPITTVYRYASYDVFFKTGCCL